MMSLDWGGSMDPSKFHVIVERDHQIMNPPNAASLELLAEYAAVPAGGRILDVGCGKGWLLREWTKGTSRQGVGLEMNPHFTREARSVIAAQGPEGQVRIIASPANAYISGRESFDAVVCIGSAVALGGFRECARWMAALVRPGVPWPLATSSHSKRPRGSDQAPWRGRGPHLESAGRHFGCSRPNIHGSDCQRSRRIGPVRIGALASSGWLAAREPSASRPGTGGCLGP